MTLCLVLKASGSEMTFLKKKEKKSQVQTELGNKLLWLHLGFNDML